MENTYIAIFHVLGGLGVVLGSAGLGVVIDSQSLLSAGMSSPCSTPLAFPTRFGRKSFFSELARSLVGALASDWSLPGNRVDHPFHEVIWSRNTRVQSFTTDHSHLAQRRVLVLHRLSWQCPVVADLQQNFES